MDVMKIERWDGPPVVVDVEVPHDELVRRLAGRRICGCCGGVNATPTTRHVTGVAATSYSGLMTTGRSSTNTCESTSA